LPDATGGDALAFSHLAFSHAGGSLRQPSRFPPVKTKLDIPWHLMAILTPEHLEPDFFRLGEALTISVIDIYGYLSIDF